MRLYNGDIYQLKKAVTGKRLVCFGAGKVFQNFFHDFQSLHLEEELYAAADNRKYGQTVTVLGKEIPIIPVSELISMKEELFLLISCADIYAVLEQLNQYSELEHTKCFITFMVRIRTRCTDEDAREYPDFKITTEQRIPKKIHYCWFGGKPLPEKNSKWLESWKRMCPDYEIIRWDESNYDVTKNQYMYEAYQEKKWGFVPDYARLDIIYKNGGIYLDTDVELIKNLDPLLSQPAFAGVDGSRYVSLGLGFGAEKGFPFLRTLMNDYENRSFRKEDGEFDLTPAPTMQKRIFEAHGWVRDGAYQRICDMTIYPERVLGAKDYYTGEIKLSPYSFSVHHYDASWLPEENQEKDESLRRLFLLAEEWKD